ncbi:glycosyltransferase [uncultured Duncaniella sp.]|uniref:glycosyltransferase n=1 Tax=uncultured Duncaniella sp. TaxID=2768039 RepID=UPI0025E737FD|nr:glycosyltransferase [uncultured Duncaniella sp.]
MRILFINTVPTERNGITGVIFNYLESFPIEKDDKIGYVAINQPDDSFKKRLDKVGADLFVIERKISNPVRYVKQLAKVAKNYDIIHAHGNSATLTLEMLAGKLAGCKLRIAHSHNTSCSAKLIDRIFRPLFYTLCNGRMACGIEAGKWLFKDRDFTVLNNGIDTEKYHFDPTIRNLTRKKLGLEKFHIIGNIANFVEAKNHVFLLTLFCQILSEMPSARLLLLGNGPLLEKSKRLAKELNISDKVFFIGSVNNPQDYMSAMDLIVMPSLFEGLPLTLVEEQANGLHAIVSDAITTQVDMTGNISYLSLDAPIDTWMKRIVDVLQSYNRDSISASEISKYAIFKIRNNGYDIYSISANLKSYYHTCLSNMAK